MKAWYGLTNKRNHEEQIANIGQRSALLRRVMDRAPDSTTCNDQAPKRRGRPRKPRQQPFGIGVHDPEELSSTSFDARYHIAQDMNNKIDLMSYVQAEEHQDDPALEVVPFISLLYV